MRNRLKSRLYFLLALVIICALCSSIMGKTYTNKDIERMKKENQRNIQRNTGAGRGGTSKTLNNRDIERMKAKDSQNAPPSYSTGKNNPKPVKIGGLKIIKKHLPYKEWEAEYREYFKRHYKDDSLILKPELIVLHYTATRNFQSVWNVFINGGNYDDGDVGVKFGHLSVHYCIDKDGAIYELLPPNVRCRGAYGVNHKAISIEMVALNEKELLANSKLIRASFKLVKYLMKKYKIPINKVYGHYEVAQGSRLVPDYLDYGDSKCPDGYPNAQARTDPGKTYMFKLRRYLMEGDL